MHTDQKRCFRSRPLLVLLAGALLLACLAVPAWAETAGWNKTGSSITYYKETETGLEKATGLTRIKNKLYYFDAEGILQTGWVKAEGGWRYFATSGAQGVIGCGYTGLQKIGKYLYCFNNEGLLQTGFRELKEGSYYFRPKGGQGVIGRALTKKWVSVDGAKRFFGAEGKMAVSTWVGSYYVDAQGKRLKNTITPDGYQVNARGKKVSDEKIDGLVTIGGKLYYYDLEKGKFAKKTFVTVYGDKYYFGADGVAVTGEVSIGGKTYKFDKDGVLNTGKRKKIKKPKILIVAGHGQGDPGATSSLGQEYLKTREFASLIVTQLKGSGKVDVTYYKNGSTGYDLYQQHVRTLGSGGANMYSQITGQGNSKRKVIRLSRGNANLPVLGNYDYVLEIHFNATAVSAKDIGGDGKTKGFSFYINSYKKQRKVENAMISKMRALGFSIFANGVHPNSTLFNARICQELGVDYSLMETAFIDDRDDMKFYEKNKRSMAKAVTACIIDYYYK